jgi:hypothetical protein
LFCHHLKLDDDWILERQHQDRANWQLAMYATHLATGSTLYCRSIKASTIAAYLHDVATFLGRYRSIDPRFVSATDTKLAPVIGKVLEEQRRWETVPNRREPFTLELHNEIATLPSIALDNCCLDAAMANWTLCNLYAGCRGVEWAQTSSSNRYLSTFLRNRFQHAYAFTLADVECFTVASQPVSIAAAIATPPLIGKIKLRFEEQKNGENGEWKLFTRNLTNPHLCFVANFIAILARHKLLTNSSPVHPLSVYRAPDGVAYNITTADIEQVLRRAAATLYNLDPVKHRAQLALWSSHSLRVGACTLLYSQGFSETEIKFLLRWKSNAFMTYLRNLAVTCRRHNVAMNETSAIPNFV